MKTDILNRKGPRKIQDIPQEVLDLLNKGEIETVNLTEWLAIDHVRLVEHTFPSTGISKGHISILKDRLTAQKKPTAMNSVKLVGATLHEQIHGDKNFTKIFENLKAHQSDTVRSYAPYLLSLNEQLSLEDKFMQSKPFVADHHFGVREVVWMALRPVIDEHLDASIDFLSSWADDPDENVRRFTTEATRPRGVWCKHIELLKETPGLALPILNKLKADPAKYVQDSVGNWLNDASKSKPEFVIALCDQWKKVSPTKETERIIKRARRTIDKK